MITGIAPLDTDEDFEQNKADLIAEVDAMAKTLRVEEF